MNKKTIITIVSILVVFIIIGATVGILIANKSGSTKKDKVKITASAAKTIEYETYDNGLVSLQIPKGWIVEVAPFDYIHYAFTAYNPDNTDYRLFFMMKSEGYLKTQAMKDWYSRYYKSAMSELPVVDPQTTEQFFKVFTEAFDVTDTGNFNYPRISNFNKIESIGTNEIGGEIIRATYTNENGRTVDGVFTTAIKEVSLYYITGLNVYNIIFYNAPENELTEWEEILNHCISTIEFSNTFTSGFYNQEAILANTIKANSKIYNQITDIITSGWEERQSTYDIISQKQSDATLGYERVYDTETGDIYKADLGFTDYDWNGKYEPVTDEMYNLPTSGYIEKVK